MGITNSYERFSFSCVSLRYSIMPTLSEENNIMIKIYKCLESGYIRNRLDTMTCMVIASLSQR